MPRHTRLEPHLANDELHDRCRRARDPVERRRWAAMDTSGDCGTAVPGIFSPPVDACGALYCFAILDTLAIVAAAMEQALGG